MKREINVEEMKDGKMEGKAKCFYDSGSKESEGEFKDDMLNGKGTEWYESVDWKINIELFAELNSHKSRV